MVTTGRSAQIWDAASGSRRTDLGELDTPIADVAWSGDGHHIACVSRKGSLGVWDVRNRSTTAMLSVAAPVELVDENDVALVLEWNASGEVLAVTQPGGAMLYRVSDGEAVWVRGFEVDGRIRMLAHTRDGLFDGDGDTFDRVVFRRGEDVRSAELLTADKLFERFHRPGLVADLLSGKVLRRPAEASSSPTPHHGMSKRL